MKIFRNIVAGAVFLITASLVGAQTLYKIESANSSKVLDVVGWNEDAGGDVQQYTYLNGLNQKWTIEDTGDGDGSVLIRNGYSLYALNVWFPIEGDCAEIRQYPYVGLSNQKWKIESVGGGGGFVKIRSVASGKVIDVQNASQDDGANIQQYSYLGGSNQQWRLVPVGQCQPATCNSITSSANPVVGTSYEVYANNVQNARRVVFPTWTVANGQDELIWYEGVYDAANNRWKRVVNTSEHNNESGSYTTHVYAYGSNGGWFWLGATNVSVTTPPPSPVPTVTLGTGQGFVVTGHCDAGLSILGVQLTADGQNWNVAAEESSITGNDATIIFTKVIPRDGGQYVMRAYAWNSAHSVCSYSNQTIHVGYLNIKPIAYTQVDSDGRTILRCSINFNNHISDYSLKFAIGTETIIRIDGSRSTKTIWEDQLVSYVVGNGYVVFVWKRIDYVSNKTIYYVGDAIYYNPMGWVPSSVNGATGSYSPITVDYTYPTYYSYIWGNIRYKKDIEPQCW